MIKYYILVGPEVKVSKIYIHDQGSVHLHLVCQVGFTLFLHGYTIQQQQIHRTIIGQFSILIRFSKIVTENSK